MVSFKVLVGGWVGGLNMYNFPRWNWNWNWNWNCEEREVQCVWCGELFFCLLYVCVYVCM